MHENKLSASVFPDGSDFSAKVCSIKHVPHNERYYGVAPESSHESLSMQLQVAAPPSDFTDDFDVSVAIHGYGDGGRIAYFGDTKCGPATAELVVSFSLVHASGVDTTKTNDTVRLAALPPTSKCMGSEGEFAVLRLDPYDKMYASVHKQFVDRWKHPTTTHSLPTVAAIFEVINPKRVQDAHTSLLDRLGNERRLWHGTRAWAGCTFREIHPPRIVSTLDRCRT